MCLTKLFAFTLHIQTKLVQGLAIHYVGDVYLKNCRLKLNSIINFRVMIVYKSSPSRKNKLLAKLLFAKNGFNLI